MLKGVVLLMVAFPITGMFRSTALKHTYEFIDCGNFMRLERFGDILVSRSCPTAKWSKTASLSPLWSSAKISYTGQSGKKGSWQGALESVDHDWKVAFDRIGCFHLQLSEYGQVGVFSEQEDNWDWIQSTLSKHVHSTSPDVNVLNGFAYTGGSTMASLSAGPAIKVVHVDAAKSFINIAKRNVDATFNGVSNARYINDDCLTFIDREIKRGNRYDGLIFDPPAFGRASNGKIWQIERDLPLLVHRIPQLLSINPAFVLISCHDIAWPAERLKSLVKSHLPKGVISTGDMKITPNDLKSNPLPLGVYVRWSMK